MTNTGAWFGESQGGMESGTKRPVHRFHPYTIPLQVCPFSGISEFPSACNWTIPKARQREDRQPLFNTAAPPSISSAGLIIACFNSQSIRRIIALPL